MEKQKKEISLLFRLSYIAKIQNMRFSLKDFLGKYLFPLIIIVLGIVFLILTIGQYIETTRIVAQYKNAEQPTIFPIIASFFIIASGIVYFLIAKGTLAFILVSNNKLKLFNLVIFGVVILLAYFNYDIIRISVDDIALKEKGLK